MQNHKVGLLVFAFFLIVSVQASSYGPPLETESYTISRSKVEATLSQGELFVDYIDITNKRNGELSFTVSVSDEVSSILSFDAQGGIVPPGNITQLEFLARGKDVGNYSGAIVFTGDIEESLQVNLTVAEGNADPPLLVNAIFENHAFTLTGGIRFLLDVQKLKPAAITNATVSYLLLGPNNESYLLGEENYTITSSFQRVKEFEVPSGAEEGRYTLVTTLLHPGERVQSKSPFMLKVAFLHIAVLGFIPMWVLVGLGGLLVLGFIVYYFVHRAIESKKKYRMQLDLKTLPKKTQGFFFLGKVAEKNFPVYFDPLKLKTHSIIAGATGGGKSITAQVFIEEALLNNIAVIVFDPTAQWSGMLRKGTDKKMFAYYPRFGLKESDAKAFKGNVRQILDARQLVDITKHIHPGQIQIFSLNRLQPNEMDLFVSNVIRGIFKSDPKENPDLKLILVFDEVHRLLAKFGGSGEGFLQIERACREFRKWGMGVMLVSQVLADFVGEIKANISTEVQMRTRDEGDLERINTKYGEEFLQSLVKASVGVGMFVNPSYNHAKPFFINFRPILHNTRRLSDEELEKYNTYNDTLDDLEYQIEQLEKESVDVFDLRMELKLMKDKVMTGNFAVVDIYLEGIKPRVEKEWAKLGKNPKKLEIQLVDEAEIKKSVEEAKKERAKAEAAEKKEEVKAEVKKENLEEKIVGSLTFDNGLMVSSLKELKDVLPNLDDDVFKGQVNEKKNEVEKWVSDNFGAAEAVKVKGIYDKAKLVEALGSVGKTAVPPVAVSKGEEKPAEKKVEGKGGGKDEKKGAEKESKHI